MNRGSSHRCCTTIGVVLLGCVAALLPACRRSSPPAAAPTVTAGAAGAAGSEGALDLRRVRAPTVAGQFYPGEPERLQATVRELMAGAPRVATAPVRMLLAPHAGYVYSGRVAASAFRQLESGFRRAVIVAANHNGDASFAGISVDRATHYQVPGLEVRVSPAALPLLERPGFVDEPAAHTMHMIEVELPFLAEANAGRPFDLVPLVVGRIDRRQARELARELARLADADTIFVFSVDMSHYHPYDVAVAHDRPCLDALERMNAGEVARCDTDGNQVLMMMTELAARQTLTPRTITYANSGDVSGDRSRVVGYGALVYEDRFVLTGEEQQALLTLARRALESQVRTGRAVNVPEELTATLPRLNAPRGAFVTLRQKGALRGCIGTLVASAPLAEDVVQNAIHAAVHDGRFQPVQPGELGTIKLSISVLDAPRALDGVRGDALVNRLGATRPGLIITFEGRRSTFLPEVWEELPEALEFLGHLCRKQGSPEGCWREPGARFETYGSQHFGEVGG